MVRTIAVGGGVLVLGACAWYFGKPDMPKSTAPTVDTSCPAPVPASDKLADLPPLTTVEVIDLARALEPSSSEPKVMVGREIEAVSFVDTAPRRMPMAREYHGPEKLPAPRQLD